MKLIWKVSDGRNTAYIGTQAMLAETLAEYASKAHPHHPVTLKVERLTVEGPARVCNCKGR